MRRRRGTVGGGGGIWTESRVMCKEEKTNIGLRCRESGLQKWKPWVEYTVFQKPVYVSICIYLTRMYYCSSTSWQIFLWNDNSQCWWGCSEMLLSYSTCGSITCQNLWKAILQNASRFLKCSDTFDRVIRIVNLQGKMSHASEDVCTMKSIMLLSIMRKLS